MILDDIAFRSLLAKGEHIQYVAHVHPFKVYPKLFRTLVLGILIPALFYYLMPPLFWIWVAWGGMGLALFMYQILEWYLDAWIISNMSVIDQNWNSLFDRQTTRIEFGNIEGLSTEVKGFWGTVLAYGNLKIEHMSGTVIVIKDVARPKRVEAEIIKNQQNFQQRQNFQDQNKLKDLLTNLLRNPVK